MKRALTTLCLLIFCMTTISSYAVLPTAVEAAIKELSYKHPNDKKNIEAGVRHTAKLWMETDGSDEAFKTFCLENYIADTVAKEKTFLRISEYMEAINGHFNVMTLELRKNLDLNTGPLLPIDKTFGGFSPSSHFASDFYNNKIAFIIALNFPEVSLEDKEALGRDRKAWAYARMGDIYTQRIPAEARQIVAKAENEADVYIASYNIYMGHLLNDQGKTIFPEDMILLSHWNLRDEIKSNYNKGERGLEKQRMTYEVMKRIISQEIPVKVINSRDYEWNPFTNIVSQSGKAIAHKTEGTERYKQLLDIFRAQKEIDKYTGDTYIDRKFDKEMEVSVGETEKLLDSYLSAPELREVGSLISKRLGRKLEGFDIWYDGFKARSGLDGAKLDAQTQSLYPNAETFEKDMPNMLVKLGFTTERAKYLAEKIAVDPARGSGHAWGAAMKGEKAHLRTRIPEQGMDYKGYNIAIHEFGHNVEQTISLYDIDYYMLEGVPNTSFTEALAFVFQKRDLELLGIKDNNPEKVSMSVLDRAWGLYEICGVSMLDIAVWKWLYANPNATAEELRDQTIVLSKEIWNKYFAPVFGISDQTVLGIYSHMISSSLYLSAYAFGRIIEFQLESYLSDKNFAQEVDRVYKLGCITPTQWMIQATGSPLSAEPILSALRDVIRNGAK